MEASATRLRVVTLSLVSTALALAIACEDDPVDPDGGGADAGAVEGDAGPRPDDAGEPSDDAGEPGVDAGGPPSGTAPMFVAQGQIGRTVVSCDDGLTWALDRTLETEMDPQLCGENQSFRCYDDASTCAFVNRGGTCERNTNCDCDHHPGASKGIAFGDRHFVATWGWGPPGAVRRSEDAVSWRVVHTGETFGGIAYGMGRFVAADRQPMVSTDDGASWTPGGMADLSDNGMTVWNVRRAGFADVDGGRFLIVGESGANLDMLLSSDGGASWWRPSDMPDGCGSGMQTNGGFGVVGGSTIVAVGRDGSCASSDGGDTWTLTPFASQIRSTLVSDGTTAWVFRRGEVLTSTDGVTWTAAPLSASGLDVGAVARSDGGTFVAVNAGWNRWYEDQRFYRSTDGVTWTELDAASAPRGHQIRFIAWGHGAASAACPAP